MFDGLEQLVDHAKSLINGLVLHSRDILGLALGQG